MSFPHSLIALQAYIWGITGRTLCQASVTENGSRSRLLEGSRAVSAPQQPQNPKVRLKVIPVPSVGPVVSAPPVLIASSHTVDYTCGHCNVVLLHADREQVHNLVIRCVAYGSYNKTEQLGPPQLAAS